MKTKKILKCLPMLALAAIMAAGCTEDDNGGNNPPAGICEFTPFVDAYSMYFQEDYAGNETYFVKGIALDIVHEYGRNIKLIEDLKGNFPKDIGTTFTAWGSGISFIESNRMDYLNRYDNQDTLIMLLKTPYDYAGQGMVPPGETFYEKASDYATIICANSVLKLSNGYVTGYILPYIEGEDYTTDTVNWEELQKTLKGD